MLSPVLTGGKELGGCSQFVKKEPRTIWVLKGQLCPMRLGHDGRPLFHGRKEVVHLLAQPLFISVRPRGTFCSALPPGSSRPRGAVNLSQIVSLLFDFSDTSLLHLGDADRGCKLTGWHFPSTLFSSLLNYIVSEMDLSLSAIGAFLFRTLPSHA